MSAADTEIQTVLALDSTMAGCAAAIYQHAHNRIVVKSSNAPRGQAEFLVPLAQQCIEEVGITFSDIDLITTLRGPGSFTGLRISLSAAKSFALALNIPVIGLVSTEVLCRQYLDDPTIQNESRDICVLMETKRSDFYMHLFDSQGREKQAVSAMCAPQIMEAGGLSDMVGIGDAIARFESEAGKGFAAHYPVNSIDTGNLAKLGLQAYAENGASQQLKPLYLRDADVSQPKSPPRKMKA